MKINKEDLKDYVGKKITCTESKISQEVYFIPDYVGSAYMIGRAKSKTLEDLVETYYSLGPIYSWETYEEPKKKVKMWQALLKTDSGEFYSSSKYYSSLEAAKLKSDDVVSLLPHTEIEVEI
jgi:hypothetical protein